MHTETYRGKQITFTAKPLDDRLEWHVHIEGLDAKLGGSASAATPHSVPLSDAMKVARQAIDEALAPADIQSDASDLDRRYEMALLKWAATSERLSMTLRPATDMPAHTQQEIAEAFNLVRKAVDELHRAYLAVSL